MRLDPASSSPLGIAGVEGWSTTEGPRGVGVRRGLIRRTQGIGLDNRNAAALAIINSRDAGGTAVTEKALSAPSEGNVLPPLDCLASDHDALRPLEDSHLKDAEDGSR